MNARRLIATAGSITLLDADLDAALVRQFDRASGALERVSPPPYPRP